MIVRNGLDDSFRRPSLRPATHHEAASRDCRPQLLTKRLASVVSWDKAHPNISWPSESEPETRGGRSWEAARGGSSQYGRRSGCSCRRDRADQCLYALWRYVQEGFALCGRYPIGADRLTNERHVYCGWRQHQQDRVADEDAVPYRQRRRFDDHRRWPRLP